MSDYGTRERPLKSVRVQNFGGAMMTPEALTEELATFAGLATPEEKQRFRDCLAAHYRRLQITRMLGE